MQTKYKNPDDETIHRTAYIAKKCYQKLLAPNEHILIYSIAQLKKDRR
jgi:hypothetical protein